MNYNNSEGYLHVFYAFFYFLVKGFNHFEEHINTGKSKLLYKSSFFIAA